VTVPAPVERARARVHPPLDGEPVALVLALVGLLVYGIVKAAKT